MPDGTSHEAMRKLAAKRLNERVKLFATFFNALGVGTIGAGVVIPAAQTPLNLEPSVFAWFLIGVSLHLVGQFAYRFLRSEE